MPENVALSAKAKAMFGKRLDEADYRALLSKNNSREITAYLKNKPFYAEWFAGINESSIHRGYLELVLKQSYVRQLTRLLRYTQEQSFILSYVILDTEFEQLLMTLYMLRDEDRSGLIAQLPLALDRYMDFDLEQLAKAKSIDEIIAVMHHTPYGKALSVFSGQLNQDLDLNACDQAIRDVFSRRVRTLIRQRAAPSARDKLTELFKIRMELDNIARIYRLKKYYGMMPEQIRALIVPVRALIPPHDFDQWIDKMHADQILDALRSSPYRHWIHNDDFSTIEDLLDRIYYRINIRELRFSESSEVVVMSYLAVLRYEIKNLISIIEGIRYHVSVEKIRPLLVY